MDRHAATRRLRRLAETAGVRIARPHPHMLRHTSNDHAGCWRGPPGCPDRRPPRRPAHHDASPERARKNLDRHPNYILAAYMASGT